MTVLVRNQRGEKTFRRRRQTAETAATSPRQQSAEAQAAAPRPATTADHEAVARPEDLSPERRRLYGPTQDTALYHCRCGYVFEADVSTSVDCPHCGGGQAW